MRSNYTENEKDFVQTPWQHEAALAAEAREARLAREAREPVLKAVLDDYYSEDVAEAITEGVANRGRAVMPDDLYPENID